MTLKESNKNRKKDKFVFVEEPIVEIPAVVEKSFNYLFWIIVGIAVLLPFII